MSRTQAVPDPSDEGEFAEPAAAPVADEPAEARPPPRPSPVWYGAILSISLLICVCWLLSYAFLDWNWQQSLGGWNWLVALVFAVIQGQMMQHWHSQSGSRS